MNSAQATMLAYVVVGVLLWGYAGVLAASFLAKKRRLTERQ